MGKIVPSNFHGRQLARRLRQLRVGHGSTQEQVGDALHMALQKVNRIECGQLPGYQELQAMLDCYKIPTREWSWYFELWEAARKRRWWQRLKVADPGYVAAEEEACTITEFQLGRVPALLQTDTYAQYVWSTGPPVAESRTSDSHPLVLMPRQERLFADPPLVLRALVHEPVLHQKGTDHEQLVQLLDRAQLPNVTIQVVPQGLGFHPGLAGSVKLLSFDDEPDIAYAETAFGRIQAEDEHMTAYARQMLGKLARDALSPDETLLLLKQLAQSPSRR